MGLLSDISQPLSGLTGGIASFIQSGIDARRQRQNIDIQNKFNMDMSNLEYQRNLKQWHLQNTYNSPLEQMNRFRQAGLNPNLVYSQGGPGNAGVSPQYKAPEGRFNYVPAVNLPEMLSRYQDFRLGQAQIENAKAQRRVLEANALIKETDAFYAPSRGQFRTGQEFNKYWKGNVEREYALGITDENQPLTPEYKSFLSAGYRSKVKMLEKYNADIALTNAKRDLTEAQTFWQKSGMPLFGPVAGLIGKMIPGVGSLGKTGRFASKALARRPWPVNPR